MSTRRIVVIYLVFGASWILLSDQLVAVVVEPDPTSTFFQSLKGLLYVIASGGLIFLLLRFRERQLAESRRIIGTMSQESQVFQRILRHNIRNDLNIITGHIDTVRDEVEDQRVIDALAAARASASDLLAISEKVRVVEGIQLTDTVPEPIDVVEVLERTVAEYRQRYPAVSIRTAVPDAAMVEGGPALRYAIGELLENAILHFDGNAEDCHIRTSIEEADGTVELSVADNGPGIPEHERIAVVQKTETPLEHGSGIGLWLVSWVLDLYRGEVTIDTSDTSGTTVRCTLQRAPPPNE